MTCNHCLRRSSYVPGYGGGDNYRRPGEVYMKEPSGWSKETYESSISSRCWTYTPYDQGWDKCPDLRADGNLQELVAIEKALSPVAEWAKDIVEKTINYPPFFPHYAFDKLYGRRVWVKLDGPEDVNQAFIKDLRKRRECAETAINDHLARRGKHP